MRSGGYEKIRRNDIEEALVFFFQNGAILDPPTFFYKGAKMSAVRKKYLLYDVYSEGQQVKCSERGSYNGYKGI